MKKYIAIVPKFENSGPTNLALDLAEEISKYYTSVEVKYLKSNISRDIPTGINVSKLSMRDLFSLGGTIVHSHTIQADIINFIIRIFNKNVVSVTTIHNIFIDDMSFLKGRRMANILWHAWSFVVKRFDAAVCISTDMINHYRGKGFQNISLIYNFVKKHNYNKKLSSEIIAGYDFKNQNATLLFAGGLNNRKNIKALIEHLKFEHVNLLVAGDGPLRVFVEDAAKSISNLKYIGFRDDLENIFPLIDALILPSLSEGFPLICIESISHGKPCLLSDIPVHREIAALGFGLTFDHINFTDLPYAISRVKMGEFQSRDLEMRFHKGHSVEFGSGLYIELFERLTNK